MRTAAGIGLRSPHLAEVMQARPATGFTIDLWELSGLVRRDLDAVLVHGRCRRRCGTYECGRRDAHRRKDKPPARNEMTGVGLHPFGPLRSRSTARISTSIELLSASADAKRWRTIRR